MKKGFLALAILSGATALVLSACADDVIDVTNQEKYAIVDELERLPVVSECYDRWLELQNQVDGFHKDEKRKRVRLSEQKEFRQVKNAVIKVADQLRSGEMTFEDRDMRMYDEQDEQAAERNYLSHLFSFRLVAEISNKFSVFTP
jgi:hypothetical protein